jgi:hypothetical protein
MRIDYQLNTEISAEQFIDVLNRSTLGQRRHTQNALGPRCIITLITAPAAAGYYPKVGFVQNTNCWELSPSR